MPGLRLRQEETDMKAEKIYQLASAILFEKPGADQIFQAFFPSLLNLLLQEALPYENAALTALSFRLSGYI